MRYIRYFTGNDLIEVQEVEGRFRISRCIEEAVERAKTNQAEYYQIFEDTDNGGIIQVTDIYFINRKGTTMTDKKEATNKAIESYNLSIKAMNDTIEALNVTVERLNKKDITFKAVKEALPQITSASNLPIAIKEEIKALSDCRTKALYTQAIELLKVKLTETIKLAADTVTNIKDAEISNTKDSTKADAPKAIDQDELDRIAGLVKEHIKTAIDAHFQAGRLLSDALNLFKAANKPASEWLTWANLSCNVKKAQAYNLVKIWNDFGDVSEFKGTSMRVLNILVHTSSDLYKQIEEQAKSLAKKGKLDTKAVNSLIDSVKPASKPAPIKSAQNIEQKQEDPDATTKAIENSLNANNEPEKELGTSNGVSDTEKDKLITELREQNLQLLARIDELTKAIKAPQAKEAITMPMLPQFSSTEPHLVLGISPVAGKVEINARYRIMALIFNAKTCPDGARALKAAKDALIKRAE